MHFIFKSLYYLIIQKPDTIFFSYKNTVYKYSYGFLHINIVLKISLCVSLYLESVLDVPVHMT